MRKRLITATQENIRTRSVDWLDVERVALVEVTSEDNDHPVESAFVSGRRTRLARGSAGDPNDSADLRPTTKAKGHIASV